MLSGVGKVQPEKLRLSARTGEVHRGGDPDHAAANAYQRLAVAGIAANSGMQMCEVNCVVLPVLHRHQHEGGTISDDDFGVSRSSS